MNSRCPKLAHGNNKKQNTEKSKQNREQKPVLKLRNQIISTRREKMPKCENKQKTREQLLYERKPQIPN